MGLSNQEKLNFNSKVLAANVQSGQPTAQWFEAIDPNFFILQDTQVLTEFSTILQYPAANLSTAQSNVAGALSGIVEDFSTAANAVRLTPSIASNGYQYLAFSTYNDFSSPRLDKWIQPQKVPQSNGQPSIGYSIQLYNGDPNSGGTLINTSDGQTGSGNTASVGWIFNYDTGTLLLSEDFKDTVTDPYIIGFRYIGKTVANTASSGSTERFFFTETQVSHGFTIGSQLIAVYKNGSGLWVPAQANDANTLAVGFITNVIDVNTFEITMGGRVEVVAHGLIVGDYYFLSTTTAGEITSFEPIADVISPVLWVEDSDHVIIHFQRPNQVDEEPPEIIERIEAVEIEVDTLQGEVVDLQTRTTALENTSVTGSSTAAGQFTIWSDVNSVTGFNELVWDDTTSTFSLAGNLSITGTVDGRDVSADGAALDSHISDNTIHFTEGSIDHGSISGLTDDDHTQYALVDGSRPMAVGTPTDSSYGGLISISPSDSIADVVDQLNDLLALIAPSAPGDLSGQALIINISTYSAKLPSGLSANWGSYTPGTNISTLVVDDTYSLLSPSTGSFFNGGLTSGNGGTVSHILNSVSNNSRAITSGVGSTGTIEITDISTYNSIWQKINAQINYTQTEGVAIHNIEHTLAGTTLNKVIYYDDTAAAPSFSVSPTATINFESLKYLSGIAYYTLGSNFLISYTGAPGIFQKAYHPTEVSRISCSGLSSVTINPSSVPAVNDSFAVIDELVTLDVANVSDTNNPRFTIRLQKPDGQQTSTTTSILARNICTYGTQSTTTYDNFVDEAQRLVLDTDTSWNSSDSLVSGNAQVRAGVLQFPDTVEYSGFSGDQAYDRKIVKAAASNGIIAFGGLSSYTQISSYNTGDLNVFLQLETDDLWFDLGRPFGSNNGNGSGDSIVNSKGARNDTGTSGNNIAFTFGIYNTATNNNEYRIRIIFRNNTLSLTSINGT